MPKEDQSDGFHVIVPKRLVTTIVTTAVVSLSSVLGFAGYQVNTSAAESASSLEDFRRKHADDIAELRRQIAETQLHCYPRGEAESDQAHWTRELDSLQRRVNAIDG